MRKKPWKHELPDSALKYILESLVPYTEANLKIGFSPALFFNDLEKIDRRDQQTNTQHNKSTKKYKKTTIRNVYYKAKKETYITIDSSGKPRLTEKGKRAITPYKPKFLGKNAYILVAFDIPENQRHKRNAFRSLLRELKFKQIQQSVWVSHYDHKKVIDIEIHNLKLSNYVHLYETVRLL